MTPQIKQRIEQIRRVEVPEGYKKTKVGIVPEEWEETTVGKCIIEYDEKTTIENQYPVLTSARSGLILQSEYYSNNQVTTSDNVGYNVLPRGYITYRSRSDDGKFKFNENTIIDKGIISYFYPVFSFNSNVSHAFMLSLLNHSIYRQSYSFVEGTAQQVLSLKKLQSLRYCVPPLAEQEKIAEILQTQDKVITLKEKLIEEKKRQKKYLMQQLLTGKHRLAGFCGEWDYVKLGSVFEERVETNCQNLELLSVTGTNGVVPRSTIETKDNSSEDKSKYLKICKGDIGYNTMRMWQGVSALSDYDGIVSPAYTILIPNEKISAKYYSYLFKMHAVIFLFYRFSQGIVDDTRSLKYPEFAKLQLYVPMDKDEQEAIAKILDTTDKEISLLQKDLEQEIQKKKALMQLLLTGIVRV